MAISDLYSSLLADLTQARSKMLSPAWQAELDKAAVDVRVAAGRQLIALEGAILSLSNASLGDIANNMKANEADLVTCTKGLEDSLVDITKVQSILAAVMKAVQVVAKILPLL